ncbi:hypothetical protein [Nocardia brasiliensis]|uniref:hypothetical protein n=1 Tax=Nocardia brasiliensis TaxID=37326 RepID=UPI003D90EECD
MYTPIKRIPIVIGKLPNGERIPLGPYTVPQLVAGVALAVITWIATMTLPGNPAVPGITGAVLTILTVIMLRALPYTGVRLTSRMRWIGRLLADRRPVGASGMPVDAESVRHTHYVAGTVAPILDQWSGEVDDMAELPRAG